MLRMGAGMLNACTQTWCEQFGKHTSETIVMDTGPSKPDKAVQKQNFVQLRIYWGDLVGCDGPDRL